MAPEAEGPRGESKVTCLKTCPTAISTPVNVPLFENESLAAATLGSLSGFVFLGLFVFANPPQSSCVQINTTDTKFHFINFACRCTVSLLISFLQPDFLYSHLSSYLEQFGKRL